MQTKIKTIDELKVITKTLREEGKKIVHCHGVFDLLHIGHIRYFRQARRHGDVLIVTITPDRFVDKGPGRPAFQENLRAEAIASLEEVDYAAVNEWPTAEETLRALRPHVYAKGSEFEAAKSDYTGKIDKEKKVIEEIGGQIVFTHDIVFSSSNLINRFISEQPKETQEYLDLFRQRYSDASIKEFIAKMANLKVLVIGDAIIDDYHFGDVIGKSNKDPVLVMHNKSCELYAGGVLAVANHTADFVKEVKLITALGETDSYEKFIRENLHPKVDPFFVYKPNSQTLLKRRFLDSGSFNKLFEEYIMDASNLPDEICQQVCSEIEPCLSGYDLVITADFGHGFVCDRIISLLCAQANYLAVNTQSNAGNRGFHTISRYPRADFVSLAEHEIRLDTRNTHSPLRTMMNDVLQRLSLKTLLVTSGRQGCQILTNDDRYIASPSLATQTVDRVGAGDAVFAISSLGAVLNLEPEVLGFIGNVVGSMAVRSIGNQKSMKKLNVEKFITALLK